MKKYIYLLLFGGLLSIENQAQTTKTTLNVASWNIEWFGSPAQSPSDDNLQEQNVKKILRYLNADIYGLCEVVDTMRLRRVVDSLGSQYGFIVSDYASVAGSPYDADWKTGQKLAYIYNKTIFANIKTRRYLGNSGTAYTNFASGRFPFLLNADVTVNGITKNINFFMLHGKAGSTASDYTRRRGGAQEMKDSLDVQFPMAINIIIGDFNDALDQTISTGSGPQSSYEPLIKDSTDEDHYRSITLPLADQSSMISYPNVVDNHVISNEAYALYIHGSARIRTDVTAVVPDFTTGNTTDHYPVFSQYQFTGVSTGIPVVPAVALGIKAYPIPVKEQLHLYFGKRLQKVTCQLTDAQGRLISTTAYQSIAAGTTIHQTATPLQKGVYQLHIFTPNQRTVISFTKL